MARIAYADCLLVLPETAALPKITSFHGSLQANTAIFVKTHKSTFAPLRQRRLRLLMAAMIIVYLISMRHGDIAGVFTCNHP